VTQQNAALVEEASAASKAMEQQSAVLVTQIGYFDAEEMHRTAVPQQPVKVEVAARPAVVGRKAARATAPRTTSATARSSLAPMPLARASGDDSSWQEF
jgi:methyl-accepting chemotaxis protein